MTDNEIKLLVNRMEDEEKRQNHRIDKLETDVERVNNIAISIEKMATSIEHMANELTRQGERIANLESQPADKWNTLIKAVLTAVVGAIIGYMMK